MKRNLILTAAVAAAVFGFSTQVWAEPVGSWHFQAYGGFSGLDVGFPNPEYYALLTPLPPKDHADKGTFSWSVLANSSLLGINQKEPLIHGQSWKARGRYYGEKNPIGPGVTSIHGEVIGNIETNDPRGQVVGWMTHYNNPTPGSFSDARVAVNYHLRLYDAGSETLVWDSGEMFFLVDVMETRNDDVCCPDDKYNYTPPNHNGCADRFRAGVLVDAGGDGPDEDDLRNASVFASFDEVVGSFSHKGVDYNVSFTGFWEADQDLPVGEGWSAELEHTHFEVRAEVWEADEPRVPRDPVISPDPVGCERN